MMPGRISFLATMVALGDQVASFSLVVFSFLYHFMLGTIKTLVSVEYKVRQVTAVPSVYNCNLTLCREFSNGAAGFSGAGGTSWWGTTRRLADCSTSWTDLRRRKGK